MFLQVSVILFTEEGVPGLGGICSWGGPGPGVSASGGVSAPGGAWWRPPRTATAAGSTHPTGMHSCYKSFNKLHVIWVNPLLKPNWYDL